MNQQNKERINEAIEVEDLTIAESAQQEIKGGAESSNNLKQLGIAIHNYAGADSSR